MRASKLDRVIVIQKAVMTKDSFNNDVPSSWNEYARVRASKHEVRDAERISAQEVGADIDARFQVRWSRKIAQVNPKDRLVCENRVYEITGIKEIGRREGRELTATTRLDR